MNEPVDISFSAPGGLSLAARAWGDPAAPTVLLLHNMWRSGADMQRIATALADAGRHAIALDLRGHGASDDAPGGRYDLQAHVDDLQAVLQQLPARSAIIGSALGGLIAMATLGERQDPLASALVVVDATPWTDRSIAREHVERMARGDGASRADPRMADAFDWTTAEPRLTAAAARLKLPVLLIRGSESELVSAQAAARFTALGDNFSEFDVEGAGHFVASDRFEAFNAVVLEFLEREAPRSPRAYEQGSDPRTLRDALGSFATGVTVVTTMGPDGRPVGITANSFSSVSLDPPLILVCPAKSSRSWPVFEAAEVFAVNVLHIGQQPTSARFASATEDRFAATPWESWDTGAPILCGSLASFECRRHAFHDAGDHGIMVGRVVRARFEPPRDPLIYFRGKYRRLHFA